MSLAGEPRVCRAVVASLLEPVLREVDGDDAVGAGEPAADDSAQADEAAAEDGADRARLDARREEDGADAGRQSACERRAAFEGRLRAHLRQRDLRHHGVLRERRRAHEVPQRIAAATESRRAVGEEAEALLVADRDAAVRAVAQAVDALAALRSEQRHDVVALADEGHPVADTLDNAGTLVAEHARHVAAGIRPRRGVEVGVADAAGDETDERLACLRLLQLDVLHDERLPELLQHCGANLHAAIVSLFVSRPGTSSGWSMRAGLSTRRTYRGSAGR